MRGLDPRIHDEGQVQNSGGSGCLQCLMDCRVKPGNDVEVHCFVMPGFMPGILPLVPAKAGTQFKTGFPLSRE